MRTCWRTLRNAALSVALLATPATTFATGADTYTAPASGVDLLQTERAHTAQGHFRPIGRLSLAYSHNPLVERYSDGTEVNIVDYQLGAYGSLGLSMWNRAHIAVLVPAYIQNGDGLPNGPSLAGAALGDIALDMRFAILDRTDPIEFALASRLTLPTGSEENFAGDGHTGLNVKAIISHELARNGVVLTGSAGTRLRDDGGDSPLSTAAELDLTIGASVPVADHWDLLGEAALASQFNHFFAERRTPANLLVGVRHHDGGWVTQMGIGPGLSQGIGTPDFRAVASIGSDAEFVPEPPEPPAEVPDTDGDGLLDPDDACPTQPEDFDGFEDHDGCPEADNDEDGVLDKTDRCPLVPEDIDGFEDTDGCPEDDNDKDGILDASDACPTEAEDFDEWEDEDGCPDPDNDGDKILDPDDSCPNEAETMNGVSDEDGCPDLVRVEQSQIRTLEPIYFDYNSDRIQERSLPLLKEMASVIDGRRDLGNIAIQGHTDSRGSDKFNQDLSERRAASVRNFLVDSGVSADRLSSAGFGETRPISRNDTAEGREQNRRVEFRLANAPAEGARAQK